MKAGWQLPYSPDGRWWWSGTQWQPAISPDGQWFWTGWGWTSWRQRSLLAGWLGVVWLVLLGAWVPVLDLLGLHHASSRTLIVVGACLGSVALVSTVAVGARLGLRRDWRCLRQAAIAGTGVLLFWYSVAMLAGPDPNGQNDHSAAVGVVTFSLPTFVVVALLLGFGGAMGLVIRSLNKDRVPG